MRVISKPLRNEIFPAEAYPLSLGATTRQRLTGVVVTTKSKQVVRFIGEIVYRVTCYASATFVVILQNLSKQVHVQISSYAHKQQTTPPCLRSGSNYPPIFGNQETSKRILIFDTFHQIMCTVLRLKRAIFDSHVHRKVMTHRPSCNRRVHDISASQC